MLHSQSQTKHSQEQLNQIYQETIKDKSPNFFEKLLTELEIGLTAVFIAFGITAITNQDLFNLFWRAAMTENETIMQIVARWNGGQIIKTIGIFLLSTAMSEILLKIIFNHILEPKDNKKENIQALAHLLEAAQKQH